MYVVPTSLISPDLSPHFPFPHDGCGRRNRVAAAIADLQARAHGALAPPVQCPRPSRVEDITVAAAFIHSARRSASHLDRQDHPHAWRRTPPSAIATFPEAGSSTGVVFLHSVRRLGSSTTCRSLIGSSGPPRRPWDPRRRLRSATTRGRPTSPPFRPREATEARVLPA
nr:unnamed protein product [Digitaria exilis]